MAKPEVITVSMRELNRLRIVQDVVDGMLRPGLAAKRLNQTDLQLRNLVNRFSEEGGWIFVQEAVQAKQPPVAARYRKTCRGAHLSVPLLPRNPTGSQRRQHPTQSGCNRNWMASVNCRNRSQHPWRTGGRVGSRRTHCHGQPSEMPRSCLSNHSLRAKPPP